jgi:tetratricopeptide (TPR) repeat protein
MQVLVVLARAAGGIVTRDELIGQCWDGRIVGDDAINRVISRIRHVAGDIADGMFSLQTIAKVGYRLVASVAEGSSRAQFLRADRRKLLLGGAAAATVAAVGVAGVWRVITSRAAPTREAKLFYERADALRSTGLAQDNRQAIAYLKEAVRAAPDYGEAWGALALAYSNALASESPDRVGGFEELREEAIRQAEQYDAGNADAAAARLPNHDFGRWAQVEQQYRGLISRHPAHSTGYNRLGTILMDVGRWDDAAGVLAAARARNALSPIIRYKLTVALWSAGRISEAEAEIDEALKRWPQHSAIWQTKVKLLALTGRPRVALALVGDPGSRPIDEDAEGSEARRLLLTALATGMRGDAERAVEAMLATVRAHPENGMPTALYCAALGHSDLALDMIEGVLLGIGNWAALRPKELPARVQTHPLFQPHARSLWPSPRFAELVKRIGLERYWAVTGTTPDFRRSH